MIKKLLVLSTSLLMLTACNTESMNEVSNNNNVKSVNDSDQVVYATIEQTNVNDTIAEQFLITSIENGIMRGELVNGSGEGIYFDLIKYKEELKEYEALWDLDTNDLISIKWTKENYDNENWLDIEKVTYNKNGNVSNGNVSMNVNVSNMKEGK